MASQCYLMSVSKFSEEITGERLFRTALEKVGDERRKKAEGMKPGRSQAACVGAGLLLQLAVQDALAAANGTDPDGIETNETNASGTDDVKNELGDFVSNVKNPSRQSTEGVKADCLAGAEGSGVKGIKVYSVLQVMELVERPIELVMDYGEKGKPYLREYPLFFNLSHSGEYVVCAMSDREIGVDIQKCSGLNVMRTAERFFSKEECRALAACGTEEVGRQFFFRLWTRKEAYGKLLGKGIMGVVSANLLPNERNMVTERELLWREWSWPEGYRIAMCQRS